MLSQKGMIRADLEGKAYNQIKKLWDEFKFMNKTNKIHIPQQP